MKQLMILVSVGAMTPMLFGSIVHTPLEAFTSGQNPATDSQGATWTVSRRARANDPVSASTILPESVGNDRKIGFQKFDSGESEVSFVKGEGSYTETDSHTGSACVYQPGEIIMKPTCKGYDSTYVRVRATLTFEVPRSGWYSMLAQFRAVDTVKLDSALDMFVDTAIVLGDTVLQQQQLTRKGDGSPTEGAVCSFTRKFLPKGTKIEFAVGPRWDDWSGYWNAHWGDATALSLSLVEEESMEDESMVKVADLGQMLLDLTPETAGTTGSFADSSGLGSWALYRFPYGSTPTDDNMVPLSRVAATDVGTTGVAFRSPDDESANPHVKVNGDEMAVSLQKAAYDISSKSWGIPFETVSPGEVLVNPSSGQCVGLRFLPKKTGVYCVCVRARDLAMNNDPQGSWGSSGVNVSISVGGAQKAKSRVSAETQMKNGYYQWMFYQTESLFLEAMAPVDIIIDPLHATDAACDNTGLSVQVVQVEAAPSSWSAGYALHDAAVNADRTNPFESQGVTWTAGSAKTPGKSGDFSKLTVAYDNEHHFKGWKEPVTVAGNTSLVQISSIDEGLSSMGVGNGTDKIQPDEFLIIPQSQVYGVCRFTVPVDGVYSVEAVCHDLNMAYKMSYPGVLCRLFANDRIPTDGRANVDDWANPPLVANLSADRLYLRAGDVIDLGVYSPTASGAWNLETACKETITIDHEIAEVVSVDISPSHETVYAGQGRVGFASDTPVTWSSVGPAEGGTSPRTARDLRKPDGEATGASFVLIPPADGSFAVAGSGEGLLKDGVVAANATVRYGWTLSGLLPNTQYTLYLFGTGGATFAAGGASVGLTGKWFGENENATEHTVLPDHAVLVVTADAEGSVSGTFSGSADEAGMFCGLQAEGPGYEAKPQRGLILLFH